MVNTNVQALGKLLAKKGLLTRTINLATTQPIPLCGADCDSRAVEPGHLFICKGAAFRSDYLLAALDAGAAAYLCSEELAPQLESVAPHVPALVTTNIRTSMAIASAEAWGHPENRMSVTGITGTKGKTTVAAFVRTILDGAVDGSKAAMLGTLETYDGVERSVSRNTTPEAPDLWRHLAHAADRGLSMVMEVSSQGLKYQRVEGLSYDVAAFLNIGIDHVSPIEHPTFEDYLASKLKIFAHARTAVINALLDPQHRERIMQAAQHCNKLVVFSGAAPCAGEPQPDVWATDVRAQNGGMSFVAHTPLWTKRLTIGLSGDFNVENAMAAIAIAQELGCTEEQIAYGLAHCRVPGRMDVCTSADQHITAVVDYAHNGMAIEKVMSSIRASYPHHYIIAVFGATGGKGAERRFEMPPAAAPYADHLIFTEDDAGPEPVETICRQMMEATPQGTSSQTVLDRTQAIQCALDLARQSTRPAVVCVLGKGHEARQLRAQGPVAMVPDGELVRHLLAQQAAN